MSNDADASVLAPLSPPHSFGLPVLDDPVPVSAGFMRLIRRGTAELWRRIVAADAAATHAPLLLSYDVHPTANGPVLIEVNTNAGGVLAAIEATRRSNICCAAWEKNQLERRLLTLLRRDLLGTDAGPSVVVAIVDDNLAGQKLLPEMHALAQFVRPYARQVLVVDAAQLEFSAGRLRHGGIAIDRIYWRSTDFLVADPSHAPIRQAMEEGSTSLSPSPRAWLAIADKRRFLSWSANPVLASDGAGEGSFRIADTLPLDARPVAAWYAERDEWVFKPTSGHASRGVYVGKRISRRKLEELPIADYLAQRYVPHPSLEHHGATWKYDLRFFADRGEVIGAAARVFQGQVVGMRTPGSGFAPLRVERSCCMVEALAAA